MVLNRAQDNKQNDGLNDLITFFASTVAHLSEVKLDKLLYIAHLYHYANFGELLTKTRFFSLAYGPHAPIIRSASKRLFENKSLYLMESRTSSDPVYSNPCRIIKACSPENARLSSSCLNTAQAVMEDWGDKPYEQILDYTTRTIPYLSTAYRDPIDWTLSRPHREFKYALSYPERVCIHHFVQGPETPLDQSNVCNQEVAVSIKEVAEIYLSICGVPPEKIPSRKYLGFDLQPVLHALYQAGDKSKNSAKKCPTEIEKAAQLTYSLWDSMAFKSTSSRVALITGMFFLKKLGYSFDGDILEDHWPDGTSYDVFKEWFGMVTIKIDINQKIC